MLLKKLTKKIKFKGLAKYSKKTEKTENIEPHYLTIFGGTGFLGKRVVERLLSTKNSYDITVACRYPDEFNDHLAHLKSTDANPSKFDNIRAEYADVTDLTSVRHSVEDADTVINCTGISYESEHNYVDIYVEGTRNVSHQSRVQGVEKLIHISAMGIGPEHRARWADFKFRGEDMAYASFPDVTIIKPNFMFGQGSKLFNLIKRGKFLPVVPVLASYKKIQPVHAEDVAEAIVKCVETDQKEKMFELGGPEELTVSETVKKTCNRATIPIPFWVGDCTFGITQFLPDPSFTRDQTFMLKKDIVVNDSLFFTFKDLDISPRELNQESLNH